MVIALRRPSNYEPKDGARFEVHLEKSRGLFGAPPTRSRRACRPTPWAPRYGRGGPCATPSHRAVALFDDGISPGDAAEELGSRVRAPIGCASGRWWRGM